MPITIELIRNNGCEDALVGGNIPYWKEVSGSNWTRQEGIHVGPFQPPDAHSGTYSFYAGNPSGAGDPYELNADPANDGSGLIDLSPYATRIDAGTFEFTFSCWMIIRAGGTLPTDETGRIILEFLDGDEVVLDDYDTTALNQLDADWIEYTDVRNAPVGARFCRVRFISTKDAGGDEAAAFWDDCSLTVEVEDSGEFDPPEGRGLRVHPYNLIRDPATILTVTTADSETPQTNLRDVMTSTKLKSTTTTLVIDGNSAIVDAGLRHADCFILPRGHNLLPGDTIQIESHNGGASVYDETFTIPENPDTDPDIWGEAGISLGTYGELFFPFGEDILDGQVQWRITIITQSPNTYVEIPPPYFGWSLEFERNHFFDWGLALKGLPIAAEKQLSEVFRLPFLAATSNDWALAQWLNDEMGITEYFYISDEPQAASAVTQKDGIRQHRLTLYGHLESLIQGSEEFLNFHQFVLNFRQEI